MASRPTTEAAHDRWLLAALAVAVSALLASTVVQSLALDGRREALSLLDNSLPSALLLSRARRDVHAIERAAVAYLTATGSDREALGAELDEVFRELKETLAEERKTPSYPGEEDVSARVASSVNELQHLVERLRSPRGAAPSLAMIQLASSRADEALGDQNEINLYEGSRAAQGLRGLSRRSMIEGLLLDAVGLAIAVGVFLGLRRRLSAYRAAAALGQLLLEHRSEELEAFVGRVAHDLRDPLGVLALGVGAAERLGPASPQWRTILDRMKANVDRSEGLIEGLLQFAQAGATPLPGQSTSVGPVVEALADQIRALGEEGLELRLDVEPATVACSRAAFASICLNLLDNAVAYTRYQPERRVELRVRRERDRVRVEVEDNGPGIPRDLRESVFEPFVRVPVAPEHGLGLGLATVKKLVEAHGGEVGLEAGLDHGSRFWFVLPAGEPLEAAVQLPH